MRIRATEFESEDPKHKGYSMLEVDYYAWIPRSFINSTPSIRDHRLSLRKNIEDGIYEVCRHYYSLIGFGGPEKDDVIYSNSSLADAGTFAEKERERFHGRFEPDVYEE